MTPSLQDYKAGKTGWDFQHKGFRLRVAHHAISVFKPHGIWCYYIYLPENMFQNPDDFAKFNLPSELKELFGGFYESFPYDETPDINWHGGVTYGMVSSMVCRRTGKKLAVVKLGCDYAHFADDDNDYSLGSVKADAEASIDTLCEMFPVNLKCSYSGEIDHPSKFYLAVNGTYVFEKFREKFNPGDAYSPA